MLTSTGGDAMPFATSSSDAEPVSVDAGAPCGRQGRQIWIWRSSSDPKS